MRLRRVGIGVTALFVAVVLTALTWGTIRATTPQTTLVGATAPELSLKTFDARVISLQSLRGRPVVLNFWASWCQTCHQEQAALNAAADRNGAQFLGVDIQDSQSAARSYLLDEHVSYPSGTSDARTVSEYRVKSPPETFFINARGLVVARYTGPIDAANLALYMTQIQ